MNAISRKPVAVGLAAAIALGSGIATGTVGPASAAPLAANQLAIKEAATDDVINVGRRHRSGAAFAALALGVIGAVIAHDAYKRHRKRHYYYEPYAYAPYPYYAYPSHPYKGHHGGHYKYHPYGIYRVNPGPPSHSYM
jgi:hypothetical protein